MRTLALNIGLAVGASGAFTDAQLQQIAAMKSSADGAAALADLQASLDLQVKNGTLSFKEYETAINAAGLAMDAQSPAAKKAAVNYHDIADQVTNLGVVTGSTSADMKTGLDTVFRTIQSDTTKGAAALKSWVSSTEGSIKQWAQGIASSIYVVGTEFQNLTHKSHDTAQNLLKDGAKLVQEFRRRTQDLAVITKKLGADSETAVMNYLSTTGQLTQQNLDNIAGMTKKQLDQLTGQAQAFSKSQQQGVQALAGPLNQQMTDILATYAQITNTVAALNAMGVTIPVDHSQLDSAAGSVSNLASQLSRLAGVNIDVSVTKPTGKASGGPVSAGTAYVIGEKGPELFIPNMSGSIVPNHELNRTQAVADSGGRRQVKLVLDTGAEFTAYLEEVISNAGVNR
jgi:hypothetical protein